jgi:hypothetical protein
MRRALTVAAVAAAVVVTACTGGSKPVITPTGPSGSPPNPATRPSTPAQLQILEPKDGQILSGAPATVHVKVKLTGAEIVPATTTHIVPTQGHLHVYLDGQIVSMNFSTNATVGNVAAGVHRLVVEFVASDHFPFNPDVRQTVTFDVTS